MRRKYVGLGIALGVAFGAALGHVGLGVALGVAFGAGGMAAARARDSSEPRAGEKPLPSDLRHGVLQSQRDWRLVPPTADLGWGASLNPNNPNALALTAVPEAGARVTLELPQTEPGQFALGPKGVPHTYRVTSEERARFLVTSPTGGFASFVKAFGEPAERRELPVLNGPPDAERLGRIAAEHRIELLGPPGMLPADLVAAA